MRIRIIDAFTDRPFTGNPAGVCLLGAGTWPDATWMRQVAAELGHETAFARPLSDDAGADWALRWFTPAVESNVCGHGTLAAAHALRTDGMAPLTVRFASSFGLLISRCGADGSITLEFPAAPATQAAAPDGLAQALGARLNHAYRTGPLGDLLAIVDDETAVRSLTPDFTALIRLTRGHGIRGIIVTALAADPRSGYDFVSRYFDPAGGISEDPVTGSAHTALAPYWSQRLGRDTLTGLQASDQTGMVHAVVRDDRVHLTGRAVTVFDGNLLEAQSTWDCGAAPQLPSATMPHPHRARQRGGHTGPTTRVRSRSRRRRSPCRGRLSLLLRRGQERGAEGGGQPFLVPAG